MLAALFTDASVKLARRPYACSVVFAVIPVVIFNFVTTPSLKSAAAPEPITPIVVKTVSVREARIDSETFQQRWLPILASPPMIEVRYVPREVRGSVADAAPGSVALQAPQPEVAVPRRRHHQIKPKPLKTKHASLDVCARHGLRKVWSHGKWPSWRCRR
jgi:hypothetical protein